MNTKELIDRIFKEPGIKFELTEFENLGKPIHEIISIYPKSATVGKDAGKTKFYLKSFIPFSSGNEEVQVYAEGGKSAPEEIVRQLWVYKLMQQYGYKVDEIDLEKGVQFGTEIGTKAADIIVYTVGIILCATKDASVVRYSVLHENEQLFASKYRLVLPTEDELRAELEQDRALLESEREMRANLLSEASDNKPEGQ